MLMARLRDSLVESTPFLQRLTWLNTTRSVHIDNEALERMLATCPPIPGQSYIFPDPGREYLLQENRHPAFANNW